MDTWCKNPFCCDKFQKTNVPFGQPQGQQGNPLNGNHGQGNYHPQALQNANFSKSLLWHAGRVAGKHALQLIFGKDRNFLQWRRWTLINSEMAAEYLDAFFIAFLREWSLDSHSYEKSYSKSVLCEFLIVFGQEQLIQAIRKLIVPTKIVDTLKARLGNERYEYCAWLTRALTRIGLRSGITTWARFRCFQHTHGQQFNWWQLGPGGTKYSVIGGYIVRDYQWIEGWLRA